MPGRFVQSVAKSVRAMIWCPATITICHQRQLKMTPDDNYPKGAIEGGFAMFRLG